MHIKLSVPTFAKDKWQNLKVSGKLKVEGNVDNLSEGYNQLKLQIDALLEQVNAENRLSFSLEELEHKTRNKEQELRSLLTDIERMKDLKESLAAFLRGFGVDPKLNRLTFDKELLLESVSSLAVAAEVAEYDTPFN